MHLSRRTLLGATAASLVACAAAAAAAAAPPYLTAKQVDLTVLLPPPPPADSAVARAEIDVVIATQAAASPERIALAQADATQSVFAMFTRTLGERFRAEALPLTTVFFERVAASESDIADPAKQAFGRVRPYMASPDVKGIAPLSRGSSWPSSHTARSTIAAIILSQILPERREALWARANEYAESRIVLGMHYPLDLDEGRRAGTAIAAVLFADAAFRADYEAVKAELRAALGG